jgi:hypothetical protein
MTKRAFSYILIIFSIFSIFACGGGGGSPGVNPSQSKLTSSAGTSLILPSGSYKNYLISGGVPPYQVASSEPSIAVGSLNDKTLSIGAISGGTAVIRVFDFKGDTIETSVTVGSSIPLYTTATNPFSLRPASTTASCAGSLSAAQRATYAISGGSPPYRVTSSNTGVLAVSMPDAAHWEAVATNTVGTATVKITDSTGASLSVDFSNVSSSAVALGVSPSDLTMPAGYEAEVTVTGGVPPYRPAGGIPAAIQVSPPCNEDGKFKIKGSLASELEIGFVDAAGSSAKVKVTINTATPNFRMSPSPISISENGNESLTLSLFGFYGDIGTGVASGSVCIYLSDPSFFALDSSRSQCSIFSPASRTFTLNTGSRGSRCVAGNTEIQVRAVDSVQQLAQASITILDNGSGCNNASGAFSLSPNAVIVSSGLTAEVLIRGGSGSYSVNSSDPSIATASVSGGVIAISGGAQSGSARILVTDSATGSSAEVAVTNATTTGSLVVSPTSLTTTPGTTAVAIVTGGSGRYGVSNVNSGVVESAAVSGNVLAVTGGASPGSIEVIVYDLTTPSNFFNVRIGNN